MDRWLDAWPALTDNGNNFISPFFTGKIGMVGSGAFAIGLLKKEHPEIDFGITPLPGEKGGSSSFAGGDSIAISATSKHKKEAWEITWTLSEEVQVEQFAKNGSIPVRADFADNTYSKQDARFAMASAAMQAGRTPYSVHFNQLDQRSEWPVVGTDSGSHLRQGRRCGNQEWTGAFPPYPFGFLIH